jgi:hypothetical protein
VSMDSLAARRVYKSVVTSIYILVTGLALISILIPSAEGYEISIYKAFPWFFWAVVVLAFILSAALLLWSQYSFLNGDKEIQQLFIFAAAGLFLIFFFLITLPLTRGYLLFGRADILIHYGITQEILSSGGIDTMYPLLHIQGVIVSTVTGLNLRSVTVFLPAIFFLIYSLFMYKILTRIEVNYRPLIALFVLLPHLWPAYIPGTLSFLLLPSIIFLTLVLHEDQSRRIPALLFLFSLSMVFFHPLMTIFANIFILLGSFILIQSPKSVSWKQFSEIPHFTIPLVSLIVLFTWYFTFQHFVNIVVRKVAWLFQGVGETQYGTYKSVLSRASVEILDIIELVIYRYSSPIVLYITSIVFFIYWLYLTESKSCFSELERKQRNLLLLACASIFIFGGLSILSLFTNLLSNFFRLSKFHFLLPTFVVVLGFYLVIESDQSNVVLRNTLVVMFLVSVVLGVTGIFTLHLSPKEKKPNQQVTEMEYKGMQWFLANKENDYRIYELGIRSTRFSSVVSGRGFGFRPPDHFNYTSSDTLTNGLGRDTYLLVTKLGKIRNEAFYPEYKPNWSFYPSDFARINNDKTANKIYDNGEFQAHSIQ